MADHDSDRDCIDAILARWEQVRPALDTSSFAITGRLRVMVLFLDALSARIAAQHGIKQGEADILVALLRRGQPYCATPTELSQTVWITPASITRRIDRLVALELVERQRDSLDDRREVLVRMTARGRELTEDFLGEVMAQEKRAFDRLSAGAQEDLVGLLRTLLLGIGASEDAPPVRVCRAARVVLNDSAAPGTDGANGAESTHERPPADLPPSRE